MTNPESDVETAASPATPANAGESMCANEPPVEIGGRGGLDPTRYGDWEKNGRSIDF